MLAWKLTILAASAAAALTLGLSVQAVAARMTLQALLAGAMSGVS
jgi:hypothetical protein